jgi:LysR family transcriptional regulator (chromosome initiation inhibitor)
MIEFRQLQALAKVMEQGSFERAAEQLAITQSAVSQRVSKLESQVGHKLLVRSLPPELTRKGELVLSHYQQVAYLQDDLSLQLSEGDQAWRRISIGTNADSLATWLLDALSPLIERENLLVDLKVDDQDRTHEMLRRGEVLGCISSSSEAIVGCNVIPLGKEVYRCLVSPAFRKRYFSGPVCADDFARAPCIEFNTKDDLQRQFLQLHFQCDYLVPKHRVPSAERFFDCVKRGWGWGMVPDEQSHDLLAAGEVEELVPGKTLDLPLYWHIWNLSSQLHRDLTQHLCREAEAILKPIDSASLED